MTILHSFRVCLYVWINVLLCRYIPTFYSFVLCQKYILFGTICSLKEIIKKMPLIFQARETVKNSSGCSVYRANINYTFIQKGPSKRFGRIIIMKKTIKFVTQNRLGLLVALLYFMEHLGIHVYVNKYYLHEKKNSRVDSTSH